MMNVNPGSVDSALAVIEAHEKDKGFKSALKALKTAQTEAKTTEAQVAEHKARMKRASATANRKELNASKAIEKLAGKKQTLDEQESELALAKKAFNTDMAQRQANISAQSTKLNAEEARLKALDGQLKQLQGDLLRKSEVLEKEKQSFEDWRAKVRSAIAA